MKVSIDIPDVYLPILMDKVNVTRTLGDAYRLLDEFARLTTSDSKHDRLSDVVCEIGEMEIPLSVLHQVFELSVRQVLEHNKALGVEVTDRGSRWSEAEDEDLKTFIEDNSSASIASLSRVYHSSRTDKAVRMRIEYLMGRRE